MAVKWHSELSRRRAPPLQRLAFSPLPTVLHIPDSLARWMHRTLVVGLCRCSTNSSPSSTTAPYSVFALSLLSSLDSHHRPVVVAPRPPTVTITVVR